MEFESPTIRNFCEEKQFEAPDETDQDLQIQPQHQNLAQVEEFE